MNHQYKYAIRGPRDYLYETVWDEACDNPEPDWKKWINRTHNDNPETRWLREIDEVKYLCAKLDALISGEEEKHPQMWRTKSFRAFYRSDDDWGVVGRTGEPVRINKEKLLPRSFGVKPYEGMVQFIDDISDDVFNSILHLG